MQDSPCNAEHLWHQVPALKIPEVPSLSLWQLSALQPTHHIFQIVPREGILAKCGDVCWEEKWKAGLSRSHTPLLPSQPTKLCSTLLGVLLSQVQASGNPTVSCKLFTTPGKGRSPSFKQRHSLPSPLGMICLRNNATFPGNGSPERRWDRFASGSTKATITGTKRQLTRRKNSRLPVEYVNEIKVLARWEVKDIKMFKHTRTQFYKMLFKIFINVSKTQ